MTGTTHTVSVELEKQVVRFFDTYNTMMRQQTYKVTNKSDHMLTYMCMKNDCVLYGKFFLWCLSLLHLLTCGPNILVQFINIFSDLSWRLLNNSIKHEIDIKSTCRIQPVIK